MPRILILSASAGAGHNRAAEAIRESAKAYCPGVETEWVDTLKYTNKVFAKLYEQSYVWMASYSPSLWGILYKQAAKNNEHKKITMPNQDSPQPVIVPRSVIVNTKCSANCQRKPPRTE